MTMRGIREQLRRLPRRRFIRFASAGAALLCLGAASLILHAHAVVERCGSRVSDSIDAIEPREVGLLLGTAPDGRYGPNAYFQYRIEAAAALYHAGKVRKIIVSGDNSRKEYNEPAAMRRALEKKGVKPEDIFEDFAGFRTLDSVSRARRVFGQTRLTIISQEFHCKRALYLAGHHGIDAIGFAARDVAQKRFRLRNHLREAFSRVLALLDVAVGREPHFLGEPVPVSTAKNGLKENLD